MDIVQKLEVFLGEGAVPSTEKTIKMVHKTSGKEIVINQTAQKKYERMGYKLISK